MLVGLWTDNADGTWSLAFIDGSPGPVVNLSNEEDSDVGAPPPLFVPDDIYVGLDEFRTISIRDVGNNFAVVACGVVATHAGGDA